MIGGVGVIMGLYVVLWGKAKDFVKEDESIQDGSCKSDVEQPLLLDKSLSNDHPDDALLHQQQWVWFFCSSS